MNDSNINGREMFEVWAPTESIWSPWVSPALFAQIDGANKGGSYPDADTFVPAWHGSHAQFHNAVIIDLPGSEAVRLAMLLAGFGYRPVPLINASPGPDIAAATEPFVVLEMRDLVNEICLATPRLANLSLAPHAPPVFFLDSHRLQGTAVLGEDMFDNRWMVFPQDFPSAQFLTDQKINTVTLVQARRTQPLEDLSHVLLRWQQGGIEILSQVAGASTGPSKITVWKPSRFKAAWYRALAIMGLRRSSVGGFGSFIPETSGSG